MIARIWHNSRLHKVGTLIGLSLNRGLPVGTWLQCMGISPSCKVCGTGIPESPQHCLFECPLAKRAWEAFKAVWQKWRVPSEVTPSWPFILLGEAVFEREDDPPGFQGYHMGASPTPSSPLTSSATSSFTSSGPRDVGSILTISTLLERSFIRPGLPLLKSTWPPGRRLALVNPLETPPLKIGLIKPSGAEWCHLNIFGEDCATIVWRFLPPCTFRISLMIEGTVAPPLPSPGFPRSESGSRPGA